MEKIDTKDSFIENKNSSHTVCIRDSKYYLISETGDPLITDADFMIYRDGSVLFSKNDKMFIFMIESNIIAEITKHIKELVDFLNTSSLNYKP